MNFTPETAIDFETAFRPEVARTRAVLAQLAAEPAVLARFLNTLSLLEHIGSRKIMNSQGAASQPVLKHLAEETRHAFFFKRAAEARAGGPLGYQPAELVAGAQARMYMGRLDARIAQDAKGPAAYLTLSLVIELRAIWLYRLLQDILSQAGDSLNLSSVLAEESLHLHDMQAALAVLNQNMAARLPAYVAYESARFAAFLDAAPRELFPRGEPHAVDGFVHGMQISSVS